MCICCLVQENILSHMHMLVARNEHDDACTAKHCISHQKFAMQIIEQVTFYFALSYELMRCYVLLGIGSCW